MGHRMQIGTIDVARSDDQVTGILEKGRLITLNRVPQKLEGTLRSLRTGLRRGGAKIPEIRKHPPETGPQNRPENRVNTPPEGSRDSFRQRKPLTLRRFHKNRRKSSQGRNAWLTTQSAANPSPPRFPSEQGKMQGKRHSAGVDATRPMGRQGQGSNLRSSDSTGNLGAASCRPIGFARSGRNHR
jgi:hypothetical protein